MADLADGIRQAHRDLALGLALVVSGGRPELQWSVRKDSMAEEAGFETSVALAKYVGLFRGKVRPKKVDRSGLEPSHYLSGTDSSNPCSSSGESDELPPEQARSSRISRLSAIGISRRPRGPSSTTGQDGRNQARPRQERWLTPGRGGKSEVSRRSGRCNPVPSGAGVRDCFEA